MNIKFLREKARQRALLRRRERTRRAAAALASADGCGGGCCGAGGRDEVVELGGEEEVVDGCMVDNDAEVCLCCDGCCGDEMDGNGGEGDVVEEDVEEEERQRQQPEKRSRRRKKIESAAGAGESGKGRGMHLGPVDAGTCCGECSGEVELNGGEGEVVVARRPRKPTKGGQARDEAKSRHMEQTQKKEEKKKRKGSSAGTNLSHVETVEGGGERFSHEAKKEGDGKKSQNVPSSASVQRREGGAPKVASEIDDLFAGKKKRKPERMDREEDERRTKEPGRGDYMPHPVRTGWKDVQKAMARARGDGTSFTEDGLRIYSYEELARDQPAGGYC